MKEKQENKVMSNFDMYASQIIYDFKYRDNSLLDACVTAYLQHSGHNRWDSHDVVEWLAKPYKEPIKVSKLWYDMMEYMFKRDERKNLKGLVNDYHFMNTFIKYIPIKYHDITMQEYLERLEVEE